MALDRPNYPPSIRIVEVGPRDGLQSIPQLIPTADKIQFIDLLSAAKLPEIEVTSFVSPKWVPQFGDGAEVFSKIKKNRMTIYTALVPNRKGLEAAVDADFRSVALFVTASETFSQKNTNCTIAESFERLLEMQPLWKEEDLRVRAYISTCWYCPYEGKIAPSKVIPIVENLFALGVDEISLGDTIGKAEPHEVAQLLDFLLKNWSATDFAMHFHDTFGHARENIKKSLEYGIRIYDSSAGGIGGCPFAPGAGGNVSTDLVLELCEELGIATNVDRAKVKAAGEFILSAVTNAAIAKA